ncbi:hypothetical protein FALBO_12989 [Fusarium albosuccineum]|uniref:Uncharacterized protein n=1 Tax=Fusarium albosuccineum TaxID=1237068 RepID=A0A8H4KZE2_9HYPO|nr:hypothetical protein FALBO_12989 [Fusarium albosuccineum]
MPIIPISSARELPSCLGALRRDCSAERSQNSNTHDRAHLDLVHWCVDGQPLSRDAANVLRGITSGFRDIAKHVTYPEGQAQIIDFMGHDGERIISFLTSGPSYVQG